MDETLFPSSLSNEEPGEDISMFPTSFAQSRLWFLYRLMPQSAFYNIPVFYRLQGLLNISVLEAAFNEIIQRHEALRTVFAEVDGQAVQVIRPRSAISMMVIDMRTVSSATRESRAYQVATAEIQQPFHLQQGPLLRVRILRMADDEHILCLTIHHIVADGWSVGILFQELSTLYAAFEQGHSSPFPPLPIQYVDFALWQREWLQGDVLTQQLTYWKKQLEGAPESLELPADYPRPAIQSFRGAVHFVSIPLQLTHALHALSRQEGVTLFMTLLAAFKVLLFLYSGSSDIVVGSGIANRNRAEIEGLIGFFVNSLAMRTRFTGHSSFRSILKSVRQTSLGAFAHQDLAFEKLVEELQPERNLSRNPLFQVAFIFQNASDSSLEFPGLTVSPYWIEMTTTRLDLEVQLRETPDGLQGIMTYSTDLFKVSTAARMRDHFCILLERIIENIDRPLASLSLLTQEERMLLLGRWHASHEFLPAYSCISTAFEAQVALHPDAIALYTRQEHWTYLILEQEANRLAHWLRSQNVQLEERIGVCLTPGIHLIVSLLAILKVGAVYVPLDRSLPYNRLAYSVNDAHLSLLLTHSTAQNSLSKMALPLIYLDQLEAVLSNLPDYPPRTLRHPDLLAYSIYTSGSTGLPKGVLVSHAGVCNLAQAQGQQFRVRPNSRILQYASLTFDASISEIMMALLNGATLCLEEEQRRHLPGSEWVYSLEEQAISVLTLPPSVLAVLPAGALNSVETIVSAGEACSHELLRRWGQEHWFYNAYGPTETTVCATIAEKLHDLGEVTIGVPMANMQVYVLDTRMQPVPIGVPGELYVGGVGVARGYQGKVDLTAERFVPHPWGRVGGERLYRTGDRVKWREDGQLQYLGREDQQIKLRGYRIELGEVEMTLKKHPMVQEAVIMLDAKDLANKQLVAYVVQKKQATDRQEQEEWYSGRVNQWQELFNGTYAPSSNSDPAFNTAGWNSSYTGKPLPEQEMREWVDATVERILVQKPLTVLEIGCGTGLLLLRIAPSCSKYVGTDFSAAALQHLQQQLALSTRALPQVKLLQLQANDFQAVATEGNFDLIILNSVVQYFPGSEYFLEVLTGALRLLKPGGCIFLGDIRNLTLLEAFQTSVQLYRAPATLSVAQFQQQMQKRLAHEEELLIDPELFYALPQQFSQISDVQILLKQGRYHNELTLFRYDVFLHSKNMSCADYIYLDWQSEHFTLSSLTDYITQNTPAFLCVTHIPNARLTKALAAFTILTDKSVHLETVHDLQVALESMPPIQHVDPEDLRSLGSQLPYSIDLTWSNVSNDGCFQAIFTRSDAAASPIAAIAHPRPQVRFKTWHEYTNDPLQGAFALHLVPQLRQFLKERLPDYMLPGVFVLLNSLPLTPHGKVDRKALPAPETANRTHTAYVPPKSEHEQVIAGIWQELLHTEKVGLHDNFFDLGGHSLLLIQMHSKLQKVLDRKLSLIELFEYPQVYLLAKYLSEGQKTDTPETAAQSVQLAETRRKSLKHRKLLRKEAWSN